MSEPYEAPSSVEAGAAEAGAAESPDRGPADSLADEALVAGVCAGRVELFEVLVRRHNPRLFRVARAILRDEGEAEDVVQDAYVRAFGALHQFEGRSSFATYLTRIAQHEAFARLRRRARTVPYDDAAPPPAPPRRDRAGDGRPDHALLRDEAVARLERAVDALPAIYRVVFVLREVDDLSVAESAAALAVSEEVVRTRLRRARLLLRDLLGEGARDAFRFLRPRCDRILAGACARFRATSGTGPGLPFPPA